MKKKKLTMEDYLLAGIGVIMVIVIVALALIQTVSHQYIVYEGKEMPVSDVEEIIADQLEVENPDKDLELNIYHDTDD